MFHDITCWLIHTPVHKILYFMKITLFCVITMRNLIDITDVSEEPIALSSKYESKSRGKYRWTIQARKNKQWGSETAIGSWFVNGKAREIMEKVTCEKRIKGREEEGREVVELWGERPDVQGSWRNMEAPSSFCIHPVTYSLRAAVVTVMAVRGQWKV